MTSTFCGLEFEYSAECLQPHRAVEGMVRHAIAYDPRWFCDVGTGSGNIAITMLKALPEARAIAVDISPAALLVARRNAERHGVADRVRFVCASALSAVKAAFDLIICNPPTWSEYEWRQQPLEPKPAIADGGSLRDLVTEQGVFSLRHGGTLITSLAK